MHTRFQVLYRDYRFLPGSRNWRQTDTAARCVNRDVPPIGLLNQFDEIDDDQNNHRFKELH